MCIDSAAKPEDMHLEIGLWPCHSQGGNQVLFNHEKQQIMAKIETIPLKIFLQAFKINKKPAFRKHKCFVFCLIAFHSCC